MLPLGFSCQLSSVVRSWPDPQSALIKKKEVGTCFYTSKYVKDRARARLLARYQHSPIPRNTSQTMVRRQPRANGPFGCDHPVLGRGRVPQTWHTTWTHSWRTDPALGCLPVWMEPLPVAFHLRSLVSPACFFTLLPTRAVQHLAGRVWSGR